MVDKAPNPYIEEVDKPIDFKYYFYLFAKNFYVIFTFFVIVVTLASIYTAKMPDQYRAVAQIIIEKPQGLAKGEREDDELPAVSWSEDYYNTQIEIMRGLSVIRQIIPELKLNDYFETDNEDQILANVRSMLSVQRIRGSRLFNIQVVTNDAQFSTSLANAIARAYIRKNFEDSLYYSKEFLNWLPDEGGGDTFTLKDPFGNFKQVTREELVETLPTIQTDPTIRTLNEKKSFNEAELESLLRQYREKHPIIIKARANIRFLVESIEAEKRRIIESLKSQAEGRGQVTYGRVIEEAQIPKVPIGPNRFKMVLIVGLAEICITFLIIFLIDFFDDTIHSPEDLERKGITLPFLGPIPILKKKRLKEEQKALIAYHEKKSEIAESFRYLRVAINFSASPESLKSLLISSCLPHEGKSFIAHNLAISLALDGNKTLLVDVDLRRPTVHRRFRLDNTTGLSNFLTSDLSFESILKESFVENLMLVTSGPISPNPGEILGSDRMKFFLEEARKRFDRIIMDSPPLTGIGDSFVLGNIVGHVILVIASSKTPWDLIQRIQKQLEKSGVKIMGTILNQVDMEKERYHGYSKYYYHTYNRYYRREEGE